MRRQYERNYKTFKNQIPQIFVFSVFLIGIIMGSLFSNSLDHSIDSEFLEVSKLVNGFITNVNTSGIPNLHLLGRSLVTYGKQILFIWLFGLVPITIPMTGLLVGMIGFSYGFTTSFFIMQYNLKGFLLCLGAYGIQGAFFVYVIFILSVESIKFAKKDVAIKQKTYLISLLVAMVCVVIISLYESYIAPVTIQYIITRFF